MIYVGASLTLFGTFLLFCAFILLLVSTLTSPVVNDISFLKLSLTNHSSVTFGALGSCVLGVGTPNNADQDVCSKGKIGYDIANIVSQTTNTAYSSASLHRLTRALVLHPIVTVLAFDAFLISVPAHCCGFHIASFLAAIVWLITLVLLIIDLVIFGAVKHHVNNDGSGASAKFGTGIWLVVAAFILTSFGSIIMCLGMFTEQRSSMRIR